MIKTARSSEELRQFEIYLHSDVAGDPRGSGHWPRPQPDAGSSPSDCSFFGCLPNTSEVFG